MHTKTGGKWFPVPGKIISFCMIFLLSAFGYEFLFFVMTLNVYNRSKSAAVTGIFTALTFLPRLFAPIYGSLTDRFNRKTLFGAGSLGVAALIIWMGLMESLEGILCLWFLISVILMAAVNIRNSMMNDIFTSKDKEAGNSIILTILNAARVVSPAAGGILALSFGSKSVLFVIAVNYFLIFAILLFSGLRKNFRQVSSEKGFLRHMKEGLDYIAGSPDLKFLFFTAVVWRLFLGLQAALFVVFIKQNLGGNDAGYGLFMSVIAAGSIGGSILGPWLAGKSKGRASILPGLIIHFACFACLGFVRNIIEVCLAGFLGFFVFYLTLVRMHSLRDRSTQNKVRGRVYGFVTAGLAPPGIISVLAGSFLAGLFGTRAIFFWAGISAILGTGIVCAFVNNSSVQGITAEKMKEPDKFKS